MVCNTLDTLRLASSRLRSDKSCPFTADEINCDVIPVVQAMAHALEMVRDADNDCIKDGQQTTIPASARMKIDDALAGYAGGRMPDQA